MTVIGEQYVRVFRTLNREVPVSFASASLLSVRGRPNAMMNWADSSTLYRLENRTRIKEAGLVHQALVELFVGNFENAPAGLVLDFDCTDD